MDPPVNHNDAGRAYVGVDWAALNDPAMMNQAAQAPDALLMLFVPREPIGKGDPLPSALTARLGVTVESGIGSGTADLLRQDMDITTPLPDAGPPIAEAVGRYLAPDWRQRTAIYFGPGGYDGLETAICAARASYYGAVQDTRRPDTPEIRRAIYWIERAIAASGSLSVQGAREELARTYRRLGDTRLARRVLLEMLHERRFLKPLALPADRSPAGLVRAEEQMRGWNEQTFAEARQMLRALELTECNGARSR
jgi:hypothetical protein